MSGIINKVKDAIGGNKDHHSDTTHTSTAGTHGTTASHGVADPSLTGHTANTQHTSNLHGSTGSGLTSTTGNHTSGLSGSSHAHGSDPTGPHSSHMGNTVDPRVGNTSGAGIGSGQYTQQTGSNLTGTDLPKALTEDKSRAEDHPGHVAPGTHATGSHTTHSGAGGLGQSNASAHGDQRGPHSSKIANKLDPTVDTKSFGTADPTTGHYAGNNHGTSGNVTGGNTTLGTSSGMSGSGHGTGLGTSRNNNPTSGGLVGTHNTAGGITGEHWTTGGSDPSGPHHSRMANQVDPHVGSGYGSNTSSGLSSGHTSSGLSTGHTSSGLSTGHTSSGLSSGHTSSGLSSGHTAPHQADPRVGAGAGYASNTSSLAGSHSTHSGVVGAGGLSGGQNTHVGTHGAHGAHAGAGSGLDSHGAHSTQKPSLMDKLNPKKDADGDGKPGFMD